MAKLTQTEATKIINEIRIKSPFTMGMTLNEYMRFFRKNCAKIYGIMLPLNEIEIAEFIIAHSE